tara:strand:- start:278 stop:565 length:288 start_codon:yes stop_codon:yes gene_type:complete
VINAIIKQSNKMTEVNIKRLKDDDGINDFVTGNYYRCVVNGGIYICSIVEDEKKNLVNLKNGCRCFPDNLDMGKQSPKQDLLRFTRIKEINISYK